MVGTLRKIGDSCGLIIEMQTLKDLDWAVGSAVKVEKAPDGKSLILTPATEAEVIAARISRVREAGLRVTDRHESVLKKLAE